MIKQLSSGLVYLIANTLCTETLPYPKDHPCRNKGDGEPAEHTETRIAGDPTA